MARKLMGTHEAGTERQSVGTDDDHESSSASHQMLSSSIQDVTMGMNAEVF